MKRFQIETLILGMVSTNCYIAKNKETGGILIVDPADQAGRVTAKIAELGGTPEAILLTHGHFDHVGAAQELKEYYEIPICCLDKETEILTNVSKNLSMMGGRGFTVAADRLFHDGEMVELAGVAVRVIHTPGHTCGSTCYYIEEEQVLFSGDTLFCGSVGRTDFPTGSMRQIHDSIHEKLFELPAETLVLPGHDQATSIDYEKKYNPY